MQTQGKLPFDLLICYLTGLGIGTVQCLSYLANYSDLSP